MIHGWDWAWYAAGVLTVIPLGIAIGRAKYRAWVRRHTYVAEIEIREHR